ncbi:MAG: methyltransferase domain-containing protein [Verrucomicrobia bacterium]|nr:methyltransferase domain-containing protein [Verrucomicrobiota bacterium]MCF7708215.1 methyltransferase domain-containing protein [Verrucomicrobiota bacterium]
MALLNEQELFVHELQQAMKMGQSRISTHLGLLQETGLVSSRRNGKHSLYKISPKASVEKSGFINLAVQGAEQMKEFESDRVNLKRVLMLRRRRTEEYFNRVAGRFDRVYGPGRSWEAFGHLLLRILPPLIVADLGSGEGMMSQLLAMRCKKVIAVDNSEKIVAFGRKKAKKNGINNLEFRLGDLQEPPIEDASVDLVILSQALHHAQNPRKAVSSAMRILKPNGQLIILDLKRHDFVQARETYGDLWLGFTETELHVWMENAGFENIELTTVTSEESAPHFETILAAGKKKARCRRAS